MLNKLKFIKNVTDSIQDRVDSLSTQHLKQRIDLLEEADIADIINSDKSKRNRLRIFSLVANELKGEVFILLNRSVREKILKELSEKQLVKIVNQLNSDDAVDLLAEIPTQLQKKILTRVDPEHALNIVSLMKYPADTAGGIMQAEIITVKSTSRVDDALAILQEHEDIETVHSVFVVDDKNKYVGVVNVWNLIAASEETLIEEVCNKSAVVVDAFMDQEEVAEVFKKYDVVTVGVVNYDNTLIGKVTVDDIVDVIHSEAQEDIMTMAGVTGAEDVFDQSVFAAIKSRFLWIAGALIGGIITGTILWQFREAIESVVVLAVFIPVVMGTAGNVATQSSTIMVRSISIGEFEKSKVSTLILKEVGIGLGIGLLAAFLVGTATFIFQHTYLLGLIVGFSMLGAILAAALIGILAPIIFKRFNIDPAIAAGPIVLTINDLTGLLIYFYIASNYLDVLKAQAMKF